MKRQRDFADLCEWQAPSPFAFRDLCTKFRTTEEHYLHLHTLLRSYAPPSGREATVSASPAHNETAEPKVDPKPTPKPTSALSKLLALAKNKQKGPSSLLLQTTSSLRLKSPVVLPDDVDNSNSVEIEETNALSNSDSQQEKRSEQLTYEEFMKTQARAPRKGEIGITAADVEKIEALGYVMSGSRNPMAQKRIEALQRQVHEKQAAKLSLEFVAESDRRMDEKTLDDLFNLL